MINVREKHMQRADKDKTSTIHRAMMKTREKHGSKFAKKCCRIKKKSQHDAVNEQR